MRSRIAKKIIFFSIFWIVVTVTGCCGPCRPKNKKADDEISEAIYEAVGEKIYYQYKKSDSEKNSIEYHYLIRDFEDENLLMDIADVANETIKEEKIMKKIILIFSEESKKVGATEPVAILCNYYEYRYGIERYETLQSLKIWGPRDSKKGDDSPYNKASTYINLKDIKNLIVTEKIVKSAEEEEIDWYEIWPDLEHYEEID